MTLGEIVDIQKLQEQIKKTGLRNIVIAWVSTAIEIRPDKVKDLKTHHTILSEISDEELNIDKTLYFLNEIYEAMETKQNKEKLIQSESINCRRV